MLTDSLPKVPGGYGDRDLGSPQVRPLNETVARHGAGITAEPTPEQAVPTYRLSSFHEALYNRAMPDHLVRLDDDEQYDEGWERVTDDPQIRGVDACKLAGEPWWQVGVGVAEFVGGAPIEGEFRQRIATALRAVAGVQRVDEEDTEVWLVTGQPPSAEALIQAVGAVVDDMAPRLGPLVYGHEYAEPDAYTGTAARKALVAAFVTVIGGGGARAAGCPSRIRRARGFGIICRRAASPARPRPGRRTARRVEFEPGVGAGQGPECAARGSSRVRSRTIRVSTRVLRVRAGCAREQWRASRVLPALAGW